MVRTRVGELGDATQPAVDAATVIVLRDGANGLEVLMQERHLETDFVGGALVFPGGRVEDSDRDLAPSLALGGDAGAVAARFGTDERGGHGLLVAAARESFEEAGILFAVDEHGTGVGADLLGEPAVASARAALAARDDGGDLAELLASRHLRLDLSAFEPFAWWVTPDGMHRRYDTRFFVAAAPAGQLDAATSDLVETVSARWLTPMEALEGGESGRFTVIFPTRKVLERLTGHADAAALLTACRGADVARIQPTIVMVDGTPMVQLDDGSAPEIP